MENAKKRDRKANFKDDEVRRLLEGIGQEKDVINCQLQGAMTARRKKEAWERVLEKVNSVSVGAARSLEEIKRKWKDLKAAVMKEQSHQKKTGGGGPIKETPFKDLILYILGDRSESVYGIEVSGTDSFTAQTASPDTQVVNIGQDMSLSDPMITVNNTVQQSSSSSLFLIVNSQESENLFVSPQPSTDTNNTFSLPSSTPNISNKFHRKRRNFQTASTSQNEELLNAWLASEIAANGVRAQVADHTIKVLKLREHKMMLEIQNLTPPTE